MSYRVYQSQSSHQPSHTQESNPHPSNPPASNDGGSQACDDSLLDIDAKPTIDLSASDLLGGACGDGGLIGDVTLGVTAPAAITVGGLELGGGSGSSDGACGGGLLAGIL
jgi:hypothetical protein